MTEPQRIYLDANSLGPPSPATADALAAFVGQWGEDLIDGWNGVGDRPGWWDLAVTLGDRIAPLLGAAPGQVVVGDSTTVLWFKLVAAALRLRPERSTILTQQGGFPTDRHAIDALGAPVLAVGPDELMGALGPDTAVLAITHVDYRTGRRLDLAGLTAAAHAVGAIAVWDLSHSVGAMDLHLDDAEVDLAAGCTYKYLSGGPGSPAFAFVAARHVPVLEQPIPGWVGHADPFSMDERHAPDPGIRRVLSGTPPIVALVALEAALDRFEDVDLAALRAHSITLTERCIALADELGLEVVTPRDPEQRGSHIALRHPHAWAVVQAAIAVGVVGDFRPPDLVRFGFAPLSVTLADVDEAMGRLGEILESAAWQPWKDALRPVVT